MSCGSADFELTYNPGNLNELKNVPGSVGSAGWKLSVIPAVPDEKLGSTTIGGWFFSRSTPVKRMSKVGSFEPSMVTIVTSTLPGPTILLNWVSMASLIVVELKRRVIGSVV